MKKRNVMTMALSLALVGVIGVGGTLAYLSDTTNDVTNKFTMVTNGITLNLEETAKPGTGYEVVVNDPNGGSSSTPVASSGTTVNADDGVNAGFTYSEIQPNAVLAKDVKLKVGVQDEETVSSYVFAMVNNANESTVFTLNINTSAWEQVATDGNKTLYAYIGTQASGTDSATHKYIPAFEDVLTLESVFTTVTVADSVDADDQLKDIVIKGYAAQVDNVGYETALKDAKAAFGFIA